MIEIKHKTTGAVLRAVDADTLQGADLSWTNLTLADLQGADLHGANLHGADLRWANLREVNLREANLCWADLREANLRGADLHEANLHGAYLRGADLRWADLRRATLRRSRGGVLVISGMPSGNLVYKPTCDGWVLDVGCEREGTTGALRDLIATDEGWPGARGEECARRRPMLAAAADFCDAWAAYHADDLAAVAHWAEVA
jgi:hypothetical protein